MRCAGCDQDNREGRKFCAGCGTPLIVSCPACAAANEPGERFCGECGAEIAVGRAAPGPPRDVGDGGSPAMSSPAGRGRPARPPLLHAEAPRREDPHVALRPRGRAQAGDGALRRREGLDGAGRAARPRRVARDPGSLLPDPHRRRAPLRGHGQPVHRRRHHGAVRRADRARGPRAARLLRGAAPARRAARLRARGEARARPRLRGAHRPQLGRGRGRQDRRRPAHGLHGAGPHRRPGAAHGGARRGRTPATSPAPPRRWSTGYFALDDLGAFQRQGRHRAGARLRAARARRRAHALRRLARARPLALRRPRRRHAHARGRAGAGAGAGTARWSASSPRRAPARAGSASSSSSAAGRAASP